MSKKRWVDLGELRFRTVENDDGSVAKIPYIVVDRSIRISRGTFNKTTQEFDNFEEVDLGKFRTFKCVKPEPGLDALLEKGHIDEDEHQKRMERIEKQSVGYKVTLPPVTE